jgi:hypothetical protein
MDLLILGGHVPALVTPPGGVPVACQRATSAWPSQKRSVLADKTIDVPLKHIQEWDNTVYIYARESVGSQLANL